MVCGMAALECSNGMSPLSVFCQCMRSMQASGPVVTRTSEWPHLRHMALLITPCACWRAVLVTKH